MQYGDLWCILEEKRGGAANAESENVYSRSKRLLFSVCPHSISLYLFFISMDFRLLPPPYASTRGFLLRCELRLTYSRRLLARSPFRAFFKVSIT